VGRLSGVRPLWAVEGGRLVLEGEGFTVDPALPHVRVGVEPARLSHASSTALTVIVPTGLEGGTIAVRVDEMPGETVYVEIGAPLASGLHQVDSPAYDKHGNLFVTFSGSRGEQAPVSIFIVRPDGTREPFVADVPNPTSLAFGPDGRLYVSSRFDGSVYRVDVDGKAMLHAGDLGVACGLAFGPDGALYVGDRSGSILVVEEGGGRARAFASLPPSIAAFHLAFGPDGALYVTGPTLDTSDVIHRIDRGGSVTTLCGGFGRPQGLAFDTTGNLYIADTLAGASAVYRVRLDAPSARELVLMGGGVIGMAFDPHGGLAVATTDAVYRIATGLRGLLP
jgi:sugar lactone lactonase YvrE